MSPRRDCLQKDGEEGRAEPFSTSLLTSRDEKKKRKERHKTVYLIHSDAGEEGKEKGNSRACQRNKSPASRGRERKGGSPRLYYVAAEFGGGCLAFATLTSRYRYRNEKERGKKGGKKKGGPGISQAISRTRREKTGARRRALRFASNDERREKEGRRTSRSTPAAAGREGERMRNWSTRFLTVGGGWQKSTP